MQSLCLQDMMEKEIQTLTVNSQWRLEDCLNQKVWVGLCPTAMRDKKTLWPGEMGIYIAK